MILPLRCVVYVVLVVALANALIVFRAPLRNIVFDSCIVEVTEEKKYSTSPSKLVQPHPDGI